ncbi:MAG: pyridoxamine 5'-phosphate oxidase family protein [Deltaproteobacteria bacterium]|nr:pyridoxamine 5'-phosphate oxidase family protein [Deltaproteobacteria bacterium]MCL5792190.1 pyridoxamine 5'-phosphate oxidase family protein [Deltaproteobacteria bacterium]
MTKLTDAMKTLIAENQCFVATANKQGIPDVGPKKSTRALDDETIIFNEGTGKRTFSNIKENPIVAIAVVNKERTEGFRFFGHAGIVTSGPIFEKAKEMAAQLNRPAPLAVIAVKVEEIYNLKPGPTAGERIA